MLLHTRLCSVGMASQILISYWLIVTNKKTGQNWCFSISPNLLPGPPAFLVKLGVAYRLCSGEYNCYSAIICGSEEINCGM